MKPTGIQLEALKWLADRHGDGCFDKNGVVLAAGESAPYTRQTWNALRDHHLVEFYNPAGKGYGRIRLRQGIAFVRTVAHTPSLWIL